jgi:multicomponent Na+:H+ antiporter subunit B
MHRIAAMVVCFAVLILTLWTYLNDAEILGRPVYEYYVQNFFKDTGARNGVAAIYLNYRVFDTLFETLMLLISVIAVMYFSWRKEHEG